MARDVWRWTLILDIDFADRDVSSMLFSFAPLSILITLLLGPIVFFITMIANNKTKK